MRILALDTGTKMGYYFRDTKNQMTENDILLFGQDLNLIYKKWIKLVDRLKPDVILAEEPLSFTGGGVSQIILKVRSQTKFNTLIRIYCIQNNIKFFGVNQNVIFNWAKKNTIPRSKTKDNSADDEDAKIIYRFFTENGEIEKRGKEHFLGNYKVNVYET